MNKDKSFFSIWKECKEPFHLQGNQHQGLFYHKPLSFTTWGKHAIEAATSKQLTESLSEA